MTVAPRISMARAVHSMTARMTPTVSLPGMAAPVSPTRRPSVFLRHERPALEDRLVVVLPVCRSLGQLDLLPGHFLVRNQAEEVRDAVQAGTPLVVRADDVPRRVLGVRRLQHHVPRAGVGIPPRVRPEVHRAQLPLAERIVDARPEAPLLLLLTDLQPELDQDDARLDDVALELGAVLDEVPVLVLRAELHYILDAGPVVPAAVEDDDFAGRREVLEVALHVQLGLLPVRRGRQGHEAEHARAHPLRDGLNGPALARGVAPLEHDDHAQPLVDNPVLKPAQLGLQLPQFLLVLLALHPGRGTFRL